jgi:hypothetical protein
MTDLRQHMVQATPFLPEWMLPAQGCPLCPGLVWTVQSSHVSVDLSALRPGVALVALGMKTA